MKSDDFNVIDLNKTDTIPTTEVDDYLRLENRKNEDREKLPEIISPEEALEERIEEQRSTQPDAEDINKTSPIVLSEDTVRLEPIDSGDEITVEQTSEYSADASTEYGGEETEEYADDDTNEHEGDNSDEYEEESDEYEDEESGEYEEFSEKEIEEQDDLNYQDEDNVRVNHSHIKQRRHAKSKKASARGNVPTKTQVKKTTSKNVSSKKSQTPVAKKTAGKRGFLDFAMAAVAVLILLGATVTGVLYVSNKQQSVAVAEFATVGQNLSGVKSIGNSTIEKLCSSLANGDTSEKTSEETGKTENIDVSVSFTSVERDLKIKFTDKATDKLISGVNFTVDLATPDKKNLILDDNDGDGVIYEHDLKAGNYMVTVRPTAGFMFPTQATEITVKDKIVYQAINIIDEIKTEDQVNIAIEDTENQDQVDTEPLLSDTVEWVESTTTLISGGDGYKEIDKKKVVDPATSTSKAGTVVPIVAASTAGASETDLGLYSNVLAEPISGGTEHSETPSGETPSDSSEAPSEQPAYVKEIYLSATTLFMTVGDTSTLSATVVGDNCNKDIVWTTDSDIVSVDPSSGAVKALKAGTATVKAITVGTDSSGKSLEAHCSVTVNDVKEDLSLVISPSELNVFVGKTATITATVKGYTNDASVIYKTLDKKIATVDNGIVTGVKVGRTTIEIVTKEKNAAGQQIKMTCEVTVTNDSVNDSTSLLKDKDGKQVYVKNGDTYEKARFSDYYSASKFYIVSEKVYKYTGWQTLDGKTYYYDKNGNYVTGEQVIRGIKYNFASDGSLSMNGGVLGIDVSKWNGNIDWNAVKNSGISFVIIRCGYRGSSTGVLVEDPKFKSYITGATAAGLKTGVYFFSQAVNEVEAVEEASMAIALMKGYKISYPVFIDTEYTSGGRANGMTVAQRTTVCKAFCETIKGAGYTPGVYASKTWLQTSVTASALSSYRIWLAQYASAPTYSGKYDLWQQTDKGSVSGVSGKVDLNISYLGY